MAITDNRTLLFIQSGATAESRFRERYGFTPTSEQIDTLNDADCAAVFSQLNASWQGIDTIARKIELSEKRVTQALKQLSQADLAMGSENAWLRNFSIDDVEDARLCLLQALNEPMMVNDWMQPFQTRWNGTDLSAAIALLAQEGLIEYDQDTGQYRRVVQEDKGDQATGGQGDKETLDEIGISLSPPLLVSPPPPSLPPVLSEIRLDGGTQPRTELNQAIIAEYAELLAQGVQFPAITVYFDGVNYWLADGFHRYWGAKQADTELAVHVIQGSQRDAILHSVGANANHGLRRSNEDKRKAVTTLLLDEEWCQWSDRAIARQCQVSTPLVGKLRQELSSQSICKNLQIDSDSRTVKRGNQIYQQYKRQSAQSEEAVSSKIQVKPDRKSVIPKVRSDIHFSICQFLNVDHPSDSEWGPVVYLVPEDLDRELERLFQNLDGGKVESAIVVTENQAGPQQDLKNRADAVCLVADSQSFCARLIWYFGWERDRFLSSFSEYGVTCVLSEGEES